MLVIAAPGLRVPLEGKPREYVTETPPDGEAGFTVPDTAYYQRRLLDGDLVAVDRGSRDVDRGSLIVANRESPTTNHESRKRSNA